MQVIKLENEAELIKSLCQLVERIAIDAVADHGTFYVGFSGIPYLRIQKTVNINAVVEKGNLPRSTTTSCISRQGASLVKFLATGLPHIKSDWSRWVIAFCDERVVPEDSEDSTMGAYCRQLLPVVPLVEDQFLAIKQGVPCEEAATDYSERLRRAFDTDKDDYRFDLLLLGMGPDGHTCSLFPGHPLLDEKSLSVAPIKDSPKPPPERVTLTYPVINRAKNCIFALSGAGKADVVKRILKDNEDFPAQRVAPTDGELYWILDKSAASLL